MRSKIVHTVLWICVLGWMILIFWFSAQSADVSSAQSGSTIRWLLETCLPSFHQLPQNEADSMIDSLQGFIRKTAHFLAYTGLGFWLANALHAYRRRMLPTAAVAWCCATIYACTDEFHQLFVPGRSGELRDVLIDSSGALLGITVITFIWWLVRCYKQKKRKKSTAA